MLALAAILPFSPALTADFVEWDDDINVTQNPHIQGLDGERLLWMWGTAEHAMRYKPLNWLGWALLYRVQGLRPLGFHLANLAFHAANTALLFLVLRRMLLVAGAGNPKAPTVTGGTVAAGGGALLWAWHPLRVEPVAWVTGLPYGMAVFFLLLAWLAYLEANRSETRNPRVCYWASVGAFALALLSYPIVLVFGAVLVALDVAVLRRLPRESGGWLAPAVRRVWLEKIPFVVLAVALLAPTLVGRVRAGSGDLYEGPAGWAEFGFFPRAMQAFYVWAYYVWKPLLPTDLSVVYTTFYGFAPGGAPFVLSLIFVVGVTVVLVLLRGRWPGVLALWLTYLAVTIPVLGLMERPHSPSDRYAHLPNLAWAVAIAFGLARCWSRPSARGVSLAVGATLALLCGFLSFWQPALWNNSLTLFEATLESLDGSVHAGDIAWRLGRLHARAGNAERAAQSFLLFRKTGLRNPDGHGYAAAFWLLRDDGEAAGHHAGEVLRANPKDHVALNVLATVAFRRRDFGRAREFFEASLTAEPGQPGVLEKLAETLDQLGQAGEAARVRERARILGTQTAAPIRSGSR